MNVTRRTALASSATCLASIGLPAAAQTAVWPNKPVNLVVPFPAGGGTDAFARPIGAAFAKLTGQNLINDNKGGGGGTVGAAIAAKLPADGYNLFMGAVHHTIAPSVYPKLTYDIEADFVPLLLVARVPQVIVVNPRKVPVNDFKEFLAYVKKNPGRLNYGSAGSGTSHHLAGELFKQQTGTFITHIPYRGAGPALQGLIAGDVEMMFDGLGSSAAHIKGGRIKALAVAGNRRNPAIPDVPSAGELGWKDYNVSTWYGVWAPKGVPADVQAKIIDTLRKSVNAPESRAIWATQGAEFADLEGNAFGGFVKLELAQWAKVVKAAGGVKPD
ncbi:MAG: Bug family tripartite tricarboxylate transporter substrate binding protein [Brachymonas sp.]